MMSDKEIDIIDELIRGTEPKICLEWGSGNSTLWFSKHKSIRSWLSVEHNGHYVEYVSAKAKPNTQVIWADNEWYLDD